MPRRRFSDEQIIAILREGDAGRPLAELLRQHGVSRNTYLSLVSSRGVALTIQP